MKNIALISLVLTCCPLALTGQTYCRSILNSAQEALNSDRLELAIEILQDADKCDYQNKLFKERQYLQLKIFDKIKEQREKAVKISNEAESAARRAQYSLAQLFEEKTTTALNKGEYAQAWLYNQQALSMAAGLRIRLPLSAGRLMLREMCPCPNLRVPKPDTAQGSIVALAYDTSGQLMALEAQVISNDSSKSKDGVKLSLLKPGLDASRFEYSEILPSLASQFLSDNGLFVSLHRSEDERGADFDFLIKWMSKAPNSLANISTIKNSGATCVAQNQDGSLLAVGDTFGRVVVIRYTGEVNEVIFSSKSAPSAVLDLAISADGRQLAAACKDGTVAVWPLNPREKLPIFVTDECSPFEGASEITPSGKAPKTFADPDAAVRCLAFSPDGKYLAYGDQKGAVTLVGLANRQKLRMTPFNKDRKQVTCLVFSPDGKLLASGDPDGYVSIWGRSSAQSWDEIALVRAHAKEVTALAFNPDGRVLSSGSKDNTLRQMSLRINPFDFLPDQALDLSDFFFKYYSGTQAARSKQIYTASFDQLPYKLEDTKLRVNGDAYTVQLANNQFYSTRAPYSAYVWAGELRRENGSGTWTEWTYSGQDRKKTRQFTESLHDEYWLYLKDITQDHQIRVPLHSDSSSIQLWLGGGFWIDLNLIPAIQGDSIITFPPEGIRFGVAPERTADMPIGFLPGNILLPFFEATGRTTNVWVGFQPGNSGGYTFQIGQPDPDSAWFYLSYKAALQIRIPKQGGWAQYKKGGGWFNLFDLMRWNQINTTVDFAWKGRHFSYANVSLNQGANFLEISPGAPVTLDLDWETRTDNSNKHCPGCVLQGYFGIKDVFSKCYISDAMSPAYYRGDSGHEHYSFQAPEQPGIYYITNRLTTESSCKEYPSKHSNSIKDALGVIRVQNSMEPK